jgi:DNA-binding YbaB/EbfC family protein
MKNIAQMMKQAQSLQTKMNTLQEELKQHEIEGFSGGGMVTVKVNGKGEVTHLKIDPSIVTADEVEVLEDLIVAAYRDAKGKIDIYVNDQMSKLGSGLGNFPMPF